jgi:hypothetical protein
MRYGVLTARRGWLGSGRHYEHAGGGTDFAAAMSGNPNYENHFFPRSLQSASLFRVTEDRATDPKTGFEIKRSIVRHIGSAVMMAVDEKKPRAAGTAIPAPGREVFLGAAGGPFG